MAEKHARRTDRHLDAAGPGGIRNVALVGATQSGKTSLLEAMLVRSGALPRAGSVADGTTVSDVETTERAHGRSVALAVAPVLHEGTKLNLIDTPGYADFVGELRAGLRASDCALVVVAANESIDAATAQVWRECAAVGMPRAVVVTKLDHARADPARIVAEAREAFGEAVHPVYVLRGDRLAGLISEGTDDPLRGELIEAVIEESEDETLMERYLAGEPVDEAMLVRDLEDAVAQSRLFPVIPVCATTGVGVEELLDLCVRAFPSPAEHRLPEAFTPAGATARLDGCDPAGPLLAEVVKTASDPYLGRTSLVRVFSGTLDPDEAVHVSGHLASFLGGDGDGAEAIGHEDHDEEERLGTLTYAFGAQQVQATRVVAGDIAVVGRLSRAGTGDTLSSVEHPLVLRPWSLPDPLLPVAIEAASRSDEDKLSSALARLAADDPGLRVEHNAETGQLVLWVMGEAHAEVALERLRSRYGVTVEQRELLIPLRECFTGPASGHGRHVKQSGGHGQYAVCHIEVEPLPEGSGFEFVDRVVGGSVPRQFVHSVEKGIRAQMERGVRLGYPVVDLRAALVDGKAHSVDSSDMAFQLAGALALSDAAAQTTVAMLEPYDEVTVLVPEELLGTVMSDLSARRGRLIDSGTVTDGRGTIRAHVPQRELVRYAIDLRSSTHGAGSFTRTFARYEPMPEDLARGVPVRH